MCLDEGQRGFRFSRRERLGIDALFGGLDRVTAADNASFGTIGLDRFCCR
jgi:hypothetical protein